MNTFDYRKILQYGIIGSIVSLAIGIVFFAITWFTVDTMSLYAYRNTGLTVISFVLGVAVSAVLLSGNMDDKFEAVIMGVIVGLLTGLLQSSVISIVMGYIALGWFDAFIGNQTLLLMFVGFISAYLGNVFFNDKINLGIIDEYLG